MPSLRGNSGTCILIFIQRRHRRRDFVLRNRPGYLQGKAGAPGRLGCELVSDQPGLCGFIRSPHRRRSWSLEYRPGLLSAPSFENRFFSCGIEGRRRGKEYVGEPMIDFPTPLSMFWSSGGLGPGVMHRGTFPVLYLLSRTSSATPSHGWYAAKFQKRE